MYSISVFLLCWRLLGRLRFLCPLIFLSCFAFSGLHVRGPVRLPGAYSSWWSLVGWPRVSSFHVGLRRVVPLVVGQVFRFYFLSVVFAAALCLFSLWSGSVTRFFSACSVGLTCIRLAACLRSRLTGWSPVLFCDLFMLVSAPVLR